MPHDGKEDPARIAERSDRIVTGLESEDSGQREHTAHQVAPRFFKQPPASLHTLSDVRCGGQTAMPGDCDFTTSDKVRLWFRRSEPMTWISVGSRVPVELPISPVVDLGGLFERHRMEGVGCQHQYLRFELDLHG